MGSVEKILLSSRNDIPFRQAQINIHQPTIGEIALIGEEAFFTGCQLLNFSKDKLDEKDRINLQNQTDFEVLMTILKNDDIAVKRNKNFLQLVLTLMFPDFKISFLPMSIMLSRKTEEGLESHLIDKDNFQSFKNIVSKMFCLRQTLPGNKYNPGGPQARALVKKFEERQRKLAKMKNRGQEQDIHILYQYISILAVGEQKDKNQLMQYTIFQLFDEYNRFKKKQDFDIYVRARLAGAKDMQSVDNWMGDITLE